MPSHYHDNQHLPSGPIRRCQRFVRADVLEDAVLLGNVERNQLMSMVPTQPDDEASSYGETNQMGKGACNCKNSARLITSTESLSNYLLLQLLYQHYDFLRRGYEKPWSSVTGVGSSSGQVARVLAEKT